MKWTLEQWRKAVFSVESSFKSFPDRAKFVRRKAIESMLPKCLQPTIKHEGGSCMVKGCISHPGVGHLFPIKDDVNRDYYG